MSGIRGWTLGSCRATCSDIVRGSAFCTVALLPAPYDAGAAFGGDGSLARVSSAKACTTTNSSIVSGSEDDDRNTLPFFFDICNLLSARCRNTYLGVGLKSKPLLDR